MKYRETILYGFTIMAVGLMATIIILASKEVPDAGGAHPR